MNNMILISKDVLRQDYFSCYNSSTHNTPNIDELAREGTIFNRHYAAAPSSAMAYTCMFTGLNAYELNRKTYSKVEPFDQGKTLFTEMNHRGYKCHIIWDEFWFKAAYPYSKVYGNQTVFHNLTISQHVGPHKLNKSDVSEQIRSNTKRLIIEEIDKLLIDNSSFVWIHLPHVLRGFEGYGEDIELMDEIVGSIRNRFSDDSIYITADHGHMNMNMGIPVYGFHVYEGAIKIPMISPRINNQKSINFATSSIQLKELLLEKRITKKEFIYSDSQYFEQENRKLAIIYDRFKYIYNKIDRTEELYDVLFDPSENVNLLMNKVYDYNRHKFYDLKEVYHYSHWDLIDDVYRKLLNEKMRIWKTGNMKKEFLYRINSKKNNLKNSFKLSNFLKSRTKGRINSKIRKSQYHI